MNIPWATQGWHDKQMLECHTAAQVSTTEAINEDCSDEIDGGDSGDGDDGDMEMPEANDEVSYFLLRLK